MQLCGLSPSQLMVIMGKALDFWAYQTDIAFEKKSREAEQQVASMQSSERDYADKLQDALNRLSAAKRRQDATLRELDSCKQELSELRSRHSETARQKQKLVELYETTKRGDDDFPAAAFPARRVSQLRVPAPPSFSMTPPSAAPRPALPSRLFASVTPPPRARLSATRTVSPFVFSRG
eukprot:TRINITY_DN1391_c0_g2_i1.p1 TRINITY_DN1391_c0_g2~~TRINITY_DN1391_c0_g2_i1.p1  ORF type:complete len:179 (+),score=40.44 TRINITY_DN1391_c0_g2_i1:358-894(+)